MKIPKTIKIGGHTVKVTLKEISMCGYWNPAENEICINKTMAQTMQESTLIHEILHVCNSTLGGGEMGHALHDSLSEQLYQVLHDNKLLK